MVKSKWNLALTALVIFVLVLILGNFWHFRIDMTEDQRFTLSQPSLDRVSAFEGPVVVDVLLSGSLPPEFARLQVETRQVLESFASENPQVKFNFVDPLEDPGTAEATLANLQGLGLTPVNVTVEDGSKMSQELVFPWAMVYYKEKTVRVPLLKNKLGADMEQRITGSVQNLEYAFADAFTKLLVKDKKRIAVLKGNGESADMRIADLLGNLREYYNLAAITLDSVAVNPQATLDELRNYDLALVAKPREPFTDAEKYVLDQYIVGGGKSLWLIDPVAMELDSLFNEQGTAIAIPRDLNLDDLFFRYGVRLNPVLVNDLYFTQIVLASGEGSGSQYNPVPWYYNPMVFSANDHPVNTNLEALRMQFAGTIDTLATGPKKTILYSSSPLSRVDGAPLQISLDMINTPPDKDRYRPGNFPLAVLLEGEFPSAYANRVKPVELNNQVTQGGQSKMIVIADGDLAENQVRNGRPLELGYDKWTNNFYGNKDFLINSINYLLDDSGLINIRSKKIEIPVLDQEQVAEHKAMWQLINIGLPIGIILLFGLVGNWLRRKKYSR